MKSKKHFYFFVGTTAELLRVAPIIKRFNHLNINYTLVCSGQNKVDLKLVKSYLDNYNRVVKLSPKKNKSSIFIFAIWSVNNFIEAFRFFRKDFKSNPKDSKVFFVIAGDPVSTVIGAIIAKLNKVELVHLESGDLSGNYFEPFPEEICRRINLFLSDYLFPPSKWALSNLKNYNKPKINTEFNTYLETFYWFLNRKVNKNFLPKKKYFILIFHRQEHVYFRKKWSLKTLRLLLQNVDPKLHCVIFNLPLSVNMIKSLEVLNNNRFTIMPHISYTKFLKLMKNSEFIATDGASNQFEAYLLGTPCLLLRDYTEQIEGLNENVLLYESREKRMLYFLKNYKKFKRKMVKTKTKPSKKVTDYLLKL